MNTLFLATAGFASAVDFMAVALVTIVSVIGLGAALLAWRPKALWLAALGCVPIVPAMVISAIGLHYSLTVAPEEDIDAAGQAPMWRVGLLIATTCLVGGCLCLVMIKRRRHVTASANP